MNPPTIPGAKPGRSAILIAINPANTATIKASALSPPIPFNTAANELKEGSLGSAELIPQKNEIATRIPPPTTNGSMLLTPLIKCL